MKNWCLITMFIAIFLNLKAKCDNTFIPYVMSEQQHIANYTYQSDIQYAKSDMLILGNTDLAIHAFYIQEEGKFQPVLHATKNGYAVHKQILILEDGETLSDNSGLSLVKIDETSFGLFFTQTRNNLLIENSMIYESIIYYVQFTDFDDTFTYQRSDIYTVGYDESIVGTKLISQAKPHGICVQNNSQKMIVFTYIKVDFESEDQILIVNQFDSQVIQKQQPGDEILEYGINLEKKNELTNGFNGIISKSFKLNGYKLIDNTKLGNLDNQHLVLLYTQRPDDWEVEFYNYKKWYIEIEILDFKNSFTTVYQSQILPLADHNFSFDPEIVINESQDTFIVYWWGNKSAFLQVLDKTLSKICELEIEESQNISVASWNDIGIVSYLQRGTNIIKQFSLNVQNAPDQCKYNEDIFTNLLPVWQNNTISYSDIRIVNGPEIVLEVQYLNNNDYMIKSLEYSFDECKEGCQSCNDKTSCVTCIPSRQIPPFCNDCSNDYIKKDGVCQSCSSLYGEYCLTCDEEMCKSCTSGDDLIINQQIIKVCTDETDICANNCKLCEQGSNCLTCGPSPSECITCLEGYELQKEKKICTSIKSCDVQANDLAYKQCMTCDTKTRDCLTCNKSANRVLQNGVCECAQFFEQGENGVCQPNQKGINSQNLQSSMGTASSLVAGSVLFSGLLFVHPALIISLLDTLQMIKYVIYIQIEFPVLVIKYFEYFEMFEFGFLPQIVPEGQYFQESPEGFMFNDVDAFFFRNSSSYVIITLALLLVYGIVRFLYFQQFFADEDIDSDEEQEESNSQSNSNSRSNSHSHSSGSNNKRKSSSYASEKQVNERIRQQSQSFHKNSNSSGSGNSNQDIRSKQSVNSKNSSNNIHSTHKKSGFSNSQSGSDGASKSGQSLNSDKTDPKDIEKLESLNMFKKILIKFLSAFEYQVMYMGVLGAFISTVINCLLSLRALSVNSYVEVFTLMLSYSLLLFFLSAPYQLYRIVKKNINFQTLITKQIQTQNQQSEECIELEDQNREHNRKYSLIYEEFKPNMLAGNYFTVISIRKIIFAIFLVLFNNFPISNQVVFPLLNILMMVYLFKAKPYLNNRHTYKDIIVEFFFMCMFLTTFGLNLGGEMDSETRYSLALVIVIFASIILGTELLMALYDSFLTFKENFVEKILRRRKIEQEPAKKGSSGVASVSSGSSGSNENLDPIEREKKRQEKLNSRKKSVVSKKSQDYQQIDLDKIQQELNQKIKENSKDMNKSNNNLLPLEVSKQDLNTLEKTNVGQTDNFYYKSGGKISQDIIKQEDISQKKPKKSVKFSNTIVVQKEDKSLEHQNITQSEKQNTKGQTEKYSPNKKSKHRRIVQQNNFQKKDTNISNKDINL